MGGRVLAHVRPALGQSLIAVLRGRPDHAHGPINEFMRNTAFFRPAHPILMRMLASLTSCFIRVFHVAYRAELVHRQAQQFGRPGFADQILGRHVVNQLFEQVRLLAGVSPCPVHRAAQPHWWETRYERPAEACAAP